MQGAWLRVWFSTQQSWSCPELRCPLRPPACPPFLPAARPQHCWDAGGGVEAAWYINHFREGAVVERNEREEMLCQVLGRAGAGPAGQR